MSKKAVLIGAGSIGRGFIGQVLSDSGYNIVFVDVSQKLVNTINEFGKYKVIVLGAEEHEHIIDNIKAYSPQDPKAVDEILQAEIITTAVGPSVLNNTANYISEGIKARFKNGIEGSLTVIACENMEYSSSKLNEYVKPFLNAEELEYCREYVCFPDSIVSRMIMPIENADPLTVKVEQYVEWIVDSKPLKSDLTGIIGMQLANNPAAYIARKIFTLTGHAMLGYMGYQKGYRFIYEAAYDDGIFGIVFKALAECGKAWSSEYRINEQEFYEYITLMLRRFSDIRLKDPIVRVCREPLRKLSIDERFIAPALTALKYSVVPYGIAEGIKAALKYDYRNDEQAVMLQQMLKSKGRGSLIKEVCGVNESNDLYKMLLN